MTNDKKYVDTLPSAEQMKKKFVTAKGNGSHTSLLRLLRSGIDRDPGGAVQSLGALSPDEGQVHRPLGQGIY